MHISPVGDAIHHDFYGVTGTDIPDDALLEFTTAVGVVRVRPDYIFPHLALLERLPGSIPPGNTDLQITSATSPPSNVVPIIVSAGVHPVVRVLQPGQDKTRPYTIAFVGNPAIASVGGAVFTPDPILTNKPGYQNLVLHGLQNLFQVTESLLRTNDFHARTRLISVFDPRRSPIAANALAQEVPQSNIMETRRALLTSFLASFGEEADLVFVVHGSTTHERASAWFTTDDPSLPGTPYTFDGVARMHGHFARIPGSAAIPVSVNRIGLTILHEFGHAASDFNNGKVTDLYNDSGAGTGFLINKKFRLVSADPIPANFGVHNGAVVASDPARATLGYPTAWRSYHPKLTDPTRPNLMDNFWESFDDPRFCQLDELTYFWFTERLNAKLSR